MLELQDFMRMFSIPHDLVPLVSFHPVLMDLEARPVHHGILNLSNHHVIYLTMYLHFIMLIHPVCLLVLPAIYFLLCFPFYSIFTNTQTFICVILND